MGRVGRGIGMVRLSLGYVLGEDICKKLRLGGGVLI